jgi:hypothetical protein
MIMISDWVILKLLNYTASTAEVISLARDKKGLSQMLICIALNHYYKAPKIKYGMRAENNHVW